MHINLNIFMHITIRHSAIRIKTGAIGGASAQNSLLRPNNQHQWYSGLSRGTYGFDTSTINIYNNTINRSEHSFAYDAAPSSSHFLLVPGSLS
jgi:hypothetical protein